MPTVFDTFCAFLWQRTIAKPITYFDNDELIDLLCDSSAAGRGVVKTGERIRQSDVTFWGVAALALGSFAMLCANLSAILPPSMMTGLHSTRLDGGSLNNLRTQVAELRDETSRIRNENSRLMTMITLTEQDQSAVNQRIGAIESSLPAMMEATIVNEGTKNLGLDRSLITASIGEPDRIVRQVEGGSVAVTRQPLEGMAPPEPDISAPKPMQMEMPAEPIKISNAPAPTPRIVSPPPVSFGIALGPQVTVQDAIVAWRDITTKVGPLILGLGPLLSGNAGVEQQRLVAGPIRDYAEAEQLCVRMIRVGISCLPVPYAGQTLPE